MYLVCNRKKKKSKTLIEPISCNSGCSFDDRKSNSKQKQNYNKCQCNCEKPVKSCSLKEDYDWNSSTLACECDKNCEILEYLKKIILHGKSYW